MALPLLLVLIAGLGVVHLLIRTSRYGAFIEGDAGRYLNMAAGPGIDGTSPPGYPLLIAASGLAGIDPREAARLINVTAFGLTLLTAGFWLRRYVTSYSVTCMAALSLAVSVPLNYYASFILSEALFTLFLLLALICSGESMRGRRKREGRLWWISASIFASLASVTRYAGVTVMAAAVLVILLGRRAPLVDKLKSGILLGAVSSIPLAAVLALNEKVYGRMFGWFDIRPPGERNWLEPEFESWMQALSGPDWFLLLSTLAAFALAAAGGGWMAYVRCTSSRSMSSFDLTPAVPFLVFAAVYGVLLLTVVPMVTRGIYVRYLAMLYVPMFLSAAILVDRFLGLKTAGPKAAATKWAAVSLMAASVFSGAVLSARANLRTTADAMESGRSEAYNNARWETSETLNWIRANPPGRRILSNHPHVFHLIDPPTPRATFARGIGGLRRRVEQEAGGAVIVWFTENPRRPFEYGPAEISELPGVERVVKLSDGAVFFVSN